MSTNRPSTELEDLLKTVGFVMYEAKALIALYNRPQMTADEVSETTGIPLARVYDTMEQLAEKGFVNVLGGRPKRFKASNPNDAFASFNQKIEAEMITRLHAVKKASADAKKLLTEQYYTVQTGITNEAFIEPLESLDEMEERTKMMLQKAVSELLIFTNVFFWQERIQKELKNALRRGVKVRILMNADSSRALSIAKEASVLGMEVRNYTGDNLLVRGTIQDNELVAFVIWATSRTQIRSVHKPHLSSNPGTIQLYRNAFEFLRDNAAPIEH